MVALLLVQPALGQEFIRAWKHSRIPRRRIVAEGDQGLHGARERRVSTRKSDRRSGPGARFPLDTLTFFGMR